jgi:hypothetical protein
MSHARDYRKSGSGGLHPTTQNSRTTAAMRKKTRFHSKQVPGKSYENDIQFDLPEWCVVLVISFFGKHTT